MAWIILGTIGVGAVTSSLNLDFTGSFPTSVTSQVDVPIHILGWNSAVICFQGVGYDPYVMGDTAPFHNISSWDNSSIYSRLMIPGQVRGRELRNMDAIENLRVKGGQHQGLGKLWRRGAKLRRDRGSDLELAWLHLQRASALQEAYPVS